MARGGPRAGSGRKRGGANKKSRAIADKAAAQGITPLEFMLKVMREPEPVCGDKEDPGIFVARYVGWRDRAFEAAKASAPYMHPRLASHEVMGKDGGPIRIEGVTITIVDGTTT